MIKIVTNEDLSEMSSWVTPNVQDAPCSNCSEVKKAIKSNDIKALLRTCSAGGIEAAETIKTCMQCIWYWIDEVDDSFDQPILSAELQNMGGKPVYLKGDGLNRWDVFDRVSTDGLACFLRAALPMDGWVGLGSLSAASRRPPQMRSKPLLFAFFLALLLAVTLRPPPRHMAAPPPGPAVRIIPPPAEQTAPEPEEAAEPLPEVHVIEECTVTWYTADTCGKTPDHPAYGITASGAPVEEGVTCAVDPEVIPLGSQVHVLYADGTVGTFRATDTGVKGEWVDIYTPDYDYAVQCGLQTLTVYWTAPKEGLV